MIQETFLDMFEQQTEPGLMVSDAEEVEGFTSVTEDFPSLFEAIEKGGRYVAVLSTTMEREVYDLIKQYTDRRDAVSVFSEGEWRQCTINSDTRLLLLTTPETLQQIEQTFPIRQAVGMVFEENK